MQQERVVDVMNVAGRDPDIGRRRGRCLGGLSGVLAMLLVLAASPAGAQQTGQSSAELYANGCCVCRTLQADGRYTDKTCVDAQSYTACAQTCRNAGSTTIVFSANATCAQGCGGTGVRR